MGVCAGRGFIASNKSKREESEKEREAPTVFIMEKPITDVVFVSSPDKCPRGYTMVSLCISLSCPVATPPLLMLLSLDKYIRIAISCLLQDYV